MLSVSLAFSRLLKTACPRCYRFQNYATRKRFYRGTSVVQSDNKWEVTLDHRRLKTPNGQVLAVNSEPLARAIAAEWDAQTEHITQPTMHLTALCNTARDNPGKLTSHDIASYLLDYISTDTILFFSQDEKELQMLQEKKWTPIIDWFEKRFNVTQEVATSLVPPPVAVETRAMLARYFLSYDFEALTAMSFGAEALKSPILMLACIERHIEPKEAVLLARLEEEYQTEEVEDISMNAVYLFDNSSYELEQQANEPATDAEFQREQRKQCLTHWGHVPWAHELNQAELTSRVAASLLVIHSSVERHTTKAKATAEEPNQ